MSCQCSKGGACDCGLYADPPLTVADHVINVICASVLVWVLWNAVQ